MARLFRFGVYRKARAEKRWSCLGDPSTTRSEAKLIMNDDCEKNGPGLAAEYAIIDHSENRVIDWRKAA
jgi:hypothetical protein